MMDQAGRRRQVLLAWAFVQRKNGELVPTNDELIHIAMARAVPPGLRTPLVNRWLHVLHHLMWLSDQGHPDPVSDALRLAPTGPPIPAPGHQPPPGRQTAASAGTVVEGPATSQPSAAQAPAPATMDQLTREMEQAEARARELFAAGRQGEAGQWWDRRNLLRQRLMLLASGEPPGGAGWPASAASAAGPDRFERVGAAAEAVPPPAPPPPPPPQPRPPAFPAPGPVPVPDPAPEPAPAPVPEPEPVAAEDPMQRLLVWRNREGLHDLKDRHVRQIVNSGARTTDEVAANLPASLKPLAGRIAAELGLSDDEEPFHSPVSPGGPAGVAPQGGPPAAVPDNQPLNPQALTWEQPLELSEELSRFASMDFSQPVGEPVPLRASTRADGALTLRWPGPTETAPVTIYRVVCHDEYAPVSPDMAETIAITGHPVLVDPRPFSSAVRHYQVWVNSGATTEEALFEQPRLHARLPVVAKPTDIDIREDEGRVIGQWMLSGNVRGVQIFRVPAERAGSGTGDPTYRICTDTPNVTGFVDDAAESGRRYLYQLLVEAEVDGVPQLSLPSVVPVTTSAVLHPVTDLTCTLGDDQDHPRFDLTWTAPPSGRVVIYRTADGPRAGADAETEEESALPQMGLQPDDRLAHPIVIEDGRCSMRDVPWPRGWSRTYFTPVTLVEDQVRVGRTTSQVRTGMVTDARIVERVSEQVLTMDWPAGAAAIKVYASPVGQPAQAAIDGAEPIAEISEDAYIRLGGLHFARPLDAVGCDLHLLPVSFAGGHAVHGLPATVRYKGLATLWYALGIRRPQHGPGPVQLLVVVRADRDYSVSPTFALVHNPHRLPLDVNDGEPIRTWLADQNPNQQPSPRFRPWALSPNWSEPGWIADVTGRTGWVRVFVDMAPDPERSAIALLDPPVAQLYLGGG
ncbi:MAG: hypothetical protein Q4F67_02615 [Propionibacteriaceae bacterium]|nr:hypothetical protein [Propionibacteriaceae bacterium]